MVEEGKTTERSKVHKKDKWDLHKCKLQSQLLFAFFLRIARVKSPNCWQKGTIETHWCSNGHMGSSPQIQMTRIVQMHEDLRKMNFHCERVCRWGGSKTYG